VFLANVSVIDAAHPGLTQKKGPVRWAPGTGHWEGPQAILARGFAELTSVSVIRGFLFCAIQGTRENAGGARRESRRAGAQEESRRDGGLCDAVGIPDDASATCKFVLLDWGSANSRAWDRSKALHQRSSPDGPEEWILLCSRLILPGILFSASSDRLDQDAPVARSSCCRLGYPGDQRGLSPSLSNPLVMLCLLFKAVGSDLTGHRSGPSYLGACRGGLRPIPIFLAVLKSNQARMGMRWPSVFRLAGHKSFQSLPRPGEKRATFSVFQINALNGGGYVTVRRGSRFIASPSLSISTNGFCKGPFRSCLLRVGQLAP